MEAEEGAAGLVGNAEGLAQVWGALPSPTWGFPGEWRAVAERSGEGILSRRQNVCEYGVMKGNHSLGNSISFNMIWSEIGVGKGDTGLQGYFSG